MSGLEAEPGPGRAEAQPGRPAGFAGRAQPAPSPRLKCKNTGKDENGKAFLRLTLTSSRVTSSVN